MLYIIIYIMIYIILVIMIYIYIYICIYIYTYIYVDLYISIYIYTYIYIFIYLHIYICVYIYIYIYIYMQIYKYICIYNDLITQTALVSDRNSVVVGKSQSDQLSIATSINCLVANTICICSFLLNSCYCLRTEYNFFKSRQIVWQKRCYVRQGEFQTGHQTKFLLKKMRTSRVCVALKTVCSF